MLDRWYYQERYQRDPDNIDHIDMPQDLITGREKNCSIKMTWNTAIQLTRTDKP